MDISLNKFISSTGYCSRREADRLIAAGRVYLNDKLADAGNRYMPGDQVVVDGILMKAPAKEKRIVMAFNKPEGITTTTDTNIHGNIISFIDYPKRIFPIGRLDKDSEGLIFLTNDGDIVNKILRAGNKHEKEYAVRVDKAIDAAFLRNMSGGLVIMGQKTLPCKVKQTGRQSFNIILVQGLNRQIRNMCESLGYKVTRLQRTRIMHIQLGTIRVGKWRLLSEAEMEELNKAIEGSSATAEKKTSPSLTALKKSEFQFQKEKKQNTGKPTKHKKHIPDKNPDKKNRLARGSGKKTSDKRSAEDKKRAAKSGSYKTYRSRGRKK